MSVFDRLGIEYQDSKYQVVISRHWNKPEIAVTVNREKIEVIQTLETFLENLHMELAIPTEKLTWKDRLKGSFTPDRNKVQELMFQATQRVIEKSKESTNQVM